MQASAFRFVGFLVHRLDFLPTGWTATFARCPTLPNSSQQQSQPNLEEPMDESYITRREELPSLEPPLRVAITGGTGGLGLALVREFRSRGAEIAFVVRGKERLQRVARELPGTHGIAWISLVAGPLALLV